LEARFYCKKISSGPLSGPFWEAPHLADLISTICAAGGVKLLVDLLKLWVTERQSRSISIKKGDVSIEISGPIDEARVQKLFDLLEEQTNSTQIFKP